MNVQIEDQLKTWLQIDSISRNHSGFSVIVRPGLYSIPSYLLIAKNVIEEIAISY